MAITPNTNLKLLKCPLALDNLNQLTFTNNQTQYNYFNSLPKLEIDNISYQRKDSTIRYPAHIDTLLDYNYCMYQNSNYNNKWFYAFITNMEYISGSMTSISISTDVYQTWQFNLMFKKSFVSREHVIDDTIGKNTIPEDLNLGEYIINNHIKDNNLLSISLVMSSTVVPSDLVEYYGGYYNGIFSGSAYYTYNFQDMLTNIDNMVKNKKQDGINALFMAPTILCKNQGGVITKSTQPKEYQLSIDGISTLDGYTPKNNKLLTYPYCYILSSNSNGTNAIYHQELFTRTSSGKLRFQVDCCLTPGCSIKMYPIYYKNTPTPYDESIVLGKFPQLNWLTDSYTNWLTQNGVNTGINIATDVGVTLGSLATKNYSGVAHGLTAVTNEVNKVYQASLVPPQSHGNTNCGDVTTANLENTFHFYLMSIKSEYANLIDNYFNVFGYKVNTYKIPNLNTRENWNYIKTIDINITGNIPQSDLQEIKNLFNNGITLWHNPNNFLNYNVSNNNV